MKNHNDTHFKNIWYINICFEWYKVWFRMWRWYNCLLCLSNIFVKLCFSIHHWYMIFILFGILLLVCKVKKLDCFSKSKMKLQLLEYSKSSCFCCSEHRITFFFRYEILFSEYWVLRMMMATFFFFSKITFFFFSRFDDTGWNFKCKFIVQKFRTLRRKI